MSNTNTNNNDNNNDNHKLLWQQLAFPKSSKVEELPNTFD